MKALENISKGFLTYFVTLLGLLFAPKKTYQGLFGRSPADLGAAILFAGISILLSLTIFSLAAQLFVPNSGFDWPSLLKNLIIVPLQLVIVMPILAATISLFAKLLRLKGSLFRSVVLACYSFALSRMPSSA